MIAAFTNNTGRVTRLIHSPTDTQKSNADLTVDAVPDMPDLQGVESTSLFVVNGALEHHPTARRKAEKNGDVAALSNWMKARVGRILEKKEVQPIEMGGVTYPAGLASQSRVAAAIQQGEAIEADGSTYEFSARDTSGEFHMLSLGELKNLRNVYSIQVSNARNVAQSKKTDIEAATTIDELNQIDVTSGWP